MTYEIRLAEERMEGRLEGKIEGRLEGKIEASMEAAKTMLKDGEPIDKVMKYLGLSEETVCELAEKIKNK